MEHMSNYKDFIQPFLDGELSREELDWFSKELESNAVLAEDIRLYREVDNAIRSKDELELRNQLDVIHDSLDKSIREPRHVPKYRKILSYAAIASLAIIISVGVLYKLQNRKLSHEKIFEKYYEPYEVTMVYRSGDTDVNTLLQQALQKYETKEFQAAIPLFEQVLEQEPGNMATNLYSGLSHMEVSQYLQAGKKFNRIIEHNNNLYIEQAEWYLGFCYLMTGKKEKAIDHFKMIAASNSYYNKPASKIAKRIK